jgi:hypothetical protein
MHLQQHTQLSVELASKADQSTIAAAQRSGTLNRNNDCKAAVASTAA